jgi:hypothetical protein
LNLGREIQALPGSVDLAADQVQFEIGQAQQGGLGGDRPAARRSRPWMRATSSENAKGLTR